MSRYRLGGVRRAAHRALPALSAVLSVGALTVGAFAPSQAGADSPALPGLTTAPATIQTTLEDHRGFPVDAVITGGLVRVRGTVRPFVPDQFVFVRTDRSGRKLATRRIAVRPGPGGTGRFSTLIAVGGRAATVTVRVTSPATPQQAGLTAAPRTIHVVRPSVAPGQRSVAAQLLQQELAGLHYAVPRSGRFDDATARAVLAFRKLADLARTEQASRIVFERLAAGAGSFHVRYPGQGAHFEGDLTHQVLAEVLPGGRVRKIYEMSSGKPSTPTVIGNFHVYLKTLGTNEKGMVDANYFIDGYAIHGYADVPPYPASHGCLRIPVADAAAVYAWAGFGFPVDVYYRGGGGSRRVMGNAGP